jgi:hypothetical protein
LGSLLPELLAARSLHEQPDNLEAMESVIACPLPGH